MHAWHHAPFRFRRLLTRRRPLTLISILLLGVAPRLPADPQSSPADWKDHSLNLKQSLPRESRLYQDLPWDYCGPRPARLGSVTQPPAPSDLTPVDIDAGGLVYHRDEDVVELVDQVQLQRGPQHIDAPSLRWQRRSGEVSTQGETFLDYHGLRVIGEQAWIDFATHQGRIHHASYRFSGAANLRGRAERIELQSQDRLHLENVGYSSCPPGRRAWSLHARTLDLDQDSGRGTARHAHLRLGGVPVFYSPYLNFPLDDRRQSGFLLPSIGSSDTTGFDITQPYYLNLAPNMDATLYPRYMSQRGLMLGGELRYLTGQDRGAISAEIIPHDSDAQEDGSGTRGALRMEQSGLFAGRLGTYLDYNLVSDDNYLEDFGNSLEVTSTRRLNQRGDLSYFGNGWTLLGRIEAFQTLDPDVAPEDRPYGRLPQILLTTKTFTFNPGLSVALQAEYDDFDHHHRVSGQRFTLSPRASWPLRRSYGHLIPSVSAQLSRYWLEDQAPGQPEDPGHLIPTFDLDGRLVFERPTRWLGHDSLQTLEPRLFYLYTPYEDQRDTPVFDSSELSFSFANLFRTNRFTGRDRIGDANQLTLGLTSRTLGRDTGEELFRASLGHIIYFADRRVQIAGDQATESSSPFAGEIAARLLEHWRGRASVQWNADADPGQSNWEKRTLQLEYRHPDHTRLLNLAYRFDQGTNVNNSYEDTDLSFRLPVGERAELVGRWLYSMQHERTMEAIAGVEFGQCCWRLRLVGRHFKNSPESTGSNSVMVQLELAGLGNIGNSIDSFLTREIHGYQVN
jgi:LPS-assembly protein